MKSKYLVLLILISLFFLNSCTLLNKTGSYTKGDSIIQNYSNTEVSKLDANLIKDMTDLYREGIDSLGTRAMLLDLETLKQFVYHLEIESKKNNVSSKDLGVRFYYARYPEQSSWDTYGEDLTKLLDSPITAQYGGRHTLVLVPTIKQGETYYDFNPNDFETYSNGLTPHYFTSFINRKPSQATVLMLPGSKAETSCQNHGQLYPPYDVSGMDY